MLRVQWPKKLTTTDRQSIAQTPTSLVHSEAVAEAQRDFSAGRQAEEKSRKLYRLAMSHSVEEAGSGPLSFALPTQNYD